MVRVNRAAAALACAATAVSGEVLEKLRAVPEGWKMTAPASPNDIIKLQIGLKQGDVEGFENALVQMSTPGSTTYGKHFASHEEVKRMLLPSDSTVDSVVSWLSEGGVDSTAIKVDADWVKFHTTVGKANSLLNTKFAWYKPQHSSGKSVLRTLQYSVPDAISSEIELIQPTTRFGSIVAELLRSPENGIVPSAGAKDAKSDGSNVQLDHTPQECDYTVTPDCYRKLYGFESYKPTVESGSKIAFASYLEEYAQYADLDLFTANVDTSLKGSNFSVVLFNGGLNTQNGTDDSGEANLDVQTIAGVTHPLPITEYSVGGRGPLVPDNDQPGPEASNEPYLDFLHAILKLPQSEIPQVLSTSYGESEQELTVPFMKSVCNLFGQLGARGVSVLFSSGDWGPGRSCKSNDGKDAPIFTPAFPASCPWVTAIGGTTKGFVSPEAGVFFSGGGFSTVFKQPKYQSAAVSSYLTKQADKNLFQYYNQKGRAYPDISGQALNFTIYDKGKKFLSFSGTSASAPLISGVIALLNDARLKAKKPVLGFLNPMIYAQKTIAAGAWTDIVNGGSVGCTGKSFGGKPINGSLIIPGAEWKCVEGWDPSTGLGTPVFPKLLEVVMKHKGGYGGGYGGHY